MYMHVLECVFYKKWSLLYDNLSVIHIHWAPIMNMFYAYACTNISYLVTYLVTSQCWLLPRTCKESKKPW